MGRKKQRRMTPAEFEAIVPPLLPHMSAERRAAARMTLVEGRTQQSIAAGHGWVRQAVASCERRLRSAVFWRRGQRLAAKISPFFGELLLGVGNRGWLLLRNGWRGPGGRSPAKRTRAAPPITQPRRDGGQAR